MTRLPMDALFLNADETLWNDGQWLYFPSLRAALAPFGDDDFACFGIGDRCSCYPLADREAPYLFQGYRLHPVKARREDGWFFIYLNTPDDPWQARHGYIAIPVAP